MAELKIYGDIGFGDDCVTAKAFIDELEALGDVDAITVRINSDGGSVTEGTAIHNALKRHPAKITTINDGAAHSIAAYVFMAGDDREVAANSLTLAHGARATGQDMTEQDTIQHLEMIRSANSAMRKTWSECLGKSEDEVNVLLEKDNWLDADKALAEGFATRIGPANPLVAHNKSKHSVPAALLDKFINHETTEADVPTKNGPTAATMKELKASFPRANSDLLVSMSEDEMTLEDASTAYITSMEEELDAVRAENEELKTKLSAMDEEATAKAMDEEEEAKATEEEEVKVKPAAKSGVKPVARAIGKPAVSASTQWQQAIQEQVKAGHPRAKAIKLANRANPGLRQRVVDEANA
jgi:ATP-dependent protease ClpP protease subunit/regulator of replication initiation timing